MRTPKDMVKGSKHSTKYGDLEVIEYFSNRKVQIRFITSGYSAEVEAGDIRKGAVRDRLSPSVYGVGYLGDGPYKSNRGSNPRKVNRCYRMWKSMIQRCYCPKALNYKYYGAKGVYVADEFHNYQTFAAFCEDPTNGYFHGAELDKDIKCVLLKVSPVYSPDTISFVTKLNNILESKHKLEELN